MLDWQDLRSEDALLTDFDRYKDDFFKQYERKSALAVPIGDILAGATPWLGSTQSFSKLPVLIGIDVLLFV